MFKLLYNQYMSKLWSWICLFLSLFLVLVYTNYRKAQSRYSDSTPSQFSISLVDLPSTTKVGERISVQWSISAPSDFKTTNTTLFYGQTSSPSALTKTDSPNAVGYQFSLPDYQVGIFSLPDLFGANLTFTQVGDYYIRPYALIIDNHVWGEEKHIKVSQ